MQVRVGIRRQLAVGHDRIHLLIDTRRECRVLDVGLLARVDRRMVGVESRADAGHAQSQRSIRLPFLAVLQLQLRHGATGAVHLVLLMLMLGQRETWRRSQQREAGPA